MLINKFFSNSNIDLINYKGIFYIDSFSKSNIHLIRTSFEIRTFHITYYRLEDHSISYNKYAYI